MKHLVFALLAASIAASQAATLTIGTAYVESMSITTLTNGVGGGTPPEEPTGLTNNLTSYWAMDESSGGTEGVTRTDRVGSEDLTEYPAYLSSAAGKVSLSADFESDNLERLIHADSAGLNLGNSNWSFAGWLYFDTLAEAFYRYFVSKWNHSTDDNKEFHLGWDHVNTALYLGISTNGAASGAHYVITTNTINTSTWYFVGFGYDADNDQMWVSINGEAKQTGSVASPGPYEGTQPLWFGGAPGNTDARQGLEGRADEWGLWTRTLSAQDLIDLYNSGSGLNPLSP